MALARRSRSTRNSDSRPEADRGAHEFIPDVYLMLGDLGKAKEHLPFAADRDGIERRQGAKEGQTTSLERRDEIELPT